MVWRWTLVAIACAWQTQALAFAAGHPCCLIPEPATRFIVQRAIDGAALRLGRSPCQQVLNEFSTASGELLTVALERLRTTPVQFLDGLRFADGLATPQCRTRMSLVAYTAPGHPVIFVCGRRFASRFRDNPKAAALIVIHEMLHAVGLGENPPASEDIATEVTRRCGS